MNPLLLTGLIVGIALVSTAMLTPVVRGAALGAGMVRQVQEDRWHRRPTPAVGGVAIFAGFALAMGVGVALAPGLLDPLATPRSRALLPLAPWEGLLAAATVAFVLGLVDDLRPLGPLSKLGGQLVAASVLLASGIGLWLTGAYAVDAFISLFWFVAVTNAVNLLDNMDGVAGGVAAIASVCLATLLFLDGQGGLGIMALALAAAATGFLAHNYPPARIFMGDSGALFIGVLLSGLALAPTQGLSRSLAAVVLVPAAVLAVPLLDTALVTVGRLLEGRSIAQGGRDHTAHHLVSLGVSEERAMWILWAMAAAGGGMGLLVRGADRSTALLLGGFLVVSLGIVGAFTLRLRLRTLEGSGGRAGALRALASLHQRFPLLVFAMDGFLVAAAYHVAYLIRWDARELAGELAYFRSTVALVVTTKLAVFTATGLYLPRWGRFGVAEAWRTARGIGLGSAAVAALLLMIQRSGLSRGVLLTDLGLCLIFVLASRVVLRLARDAETMPRDDATPAVLLAPMVDMELLHRATLAAAGGVEVRPVAGADPGLRVARTTLGALTVYGEHDALDRALAETGAATVVVRARGSDDHLPEAVRRHLSHHGGVDVYRLRVELDQVQAPPVPGPLRAGREVGDP